MPGPVIDNSRVGEVVDAQLLGSGAGNPAAVTVTASPMTYTNTSGRIQRLYVQAAAGSTVTVAKKGVTLINQVQAAATNSTADVMLGPGESAVITYSAAPVVVTDTP
jgi:hypothetical protein